MTFKDVMKKDRDAVFNNLNEFAEEVIYKPVADGVDPITVTALVDRQPEKEVEGKDGDYIEKTAYVEISSFAMTGIPKPVLFGDTVTFDSLDWSVEESESIPRLGIYRVYVVCEELIKRRVYGRS